jgi:hypothetical protein
MPAAFAQSAPPACDGSIAIVRHSVIKPEAGMDKFLAAVAAQKAWYQSHGLKEDIVFATKIIDRDPATGKQSYSSTEALTFHYYPSTVGGEPKHDAAWDAFVKLFSDSSTIKDTYFVCVPKPMVPMIM